MKVMLDTSTIIAEFILPDSKFPQMMRHIIARDQMVLSKRVVQEVKDIVRDKFPEEELAVEYFFEELSFESVEDASEELKKRMSTAVRENDLLAAAVAAHCDVVISLDEEVLNQHIEGMLICTPSGYMTEANG